MAARISYSGDGVYQLEITKSEVAALANRLMAAFASTTAQTVKIDISHSAFKQIVIAIREGDDDD